MNYVSLKGLGKYYEKIQNLKFWVQHLIIYDFFGGLNDQISILRDFTCYLSKISLGSKNDTLLKILLPEFLLCLPFDSQLCKME